MHQIAKTRRLPEATKTVLSLPVAATPKQSVVEAECGGCATRFDLVSLMINV